MKNSSFRISAEKVQVYCHHVSIKIVGYFYDLYDRVGELSGIYGRAGKYIRSD